MDDLLTFRANQYAALGDPNRLAIADVLATGDHTPTALAELTGLSSNLLAFHLNVLANAQIITRTRSEGDKRRRYVTLHHNAPALEHTPRTTGTVLFVCTHNQARSQFAAALWRHYTGHPALSAGATPAKAPDPTAVSVAEQFGMDTSSWKTAGYTDITTRPDVVISVCDRAYESGVPFNAHVWHWSIPDPNGRPRSQYEQTVRQLDRRITRLLAQNDRVEAISA